ncbi:site-specific tyrosine recombinase XerC [Novipirellula aureliae]|uniref:Site-specific tyrosine recombinase XerC n=1 Tax=Novipirellula aureliae TaxID=2527966 RepID=A0A5C6DMW9_9BACT|nr:site-specific integrase [Novipirellula aureliae]TWU37505.1 site-specific tyrosine recombinase XerC [Novipirellula aureliae]
MASVYKRTSDKGKRGAAWHFSYLDETGKRRQRKGFTDKAATEKLALQLEEESKMVREGLKDSKPDSDQLAIAIQIKKYLKHLRQRDVSENQIENLRGRIERTTQGCDFVSITDIAAQQVEDYLAERREKGLSKQTSNHYRQAMHQFCRWLRKRALIPVNPIADIPKLNVDTDRRHDRRAISVDEFQRLIVAAEGGSRVESIPGIDRAVMYILSAWTGYRRGEISSLTLASFDLDGAPPRVTVDARYSKRRKTDVQVLHPEVVNKLREWLSVRVPIHDLFLFPLTKGTCGTDRKTSKMMKRDLAVARNSWIDEAGDDDEERERREATDYLKYESSSGLFADFHANRHTFITNLARAGVAPKLTQTLARHSDIRLTMNVYTHTDLAEKVDAVGKLPSFTAAPMIIIAEEKAPPVESEAKDTVQRHSSNSVSQDGKAGQSMAEDENEAAEDGQSGGCRKALKSQDLAEHDSTCHDKEEVHPRGFEPLTFGSVGGYFTQACCDLKPSTGSRLRVFFPLCNSY